jgi:hypothetical protein
MSTTHYVKHPSSPHDKLRAKDLAWCEGGTPFRFRMRVGEPRTEDGRYTIHLCSVEVSPPDSKPEGTATFREDSLDQVTVDSIVAVPARSDLALMHFEFAIIRDKKSEFLLRPR